MQTIMPKRRAFHLWHDEQGSNVAQAAGVAMAATLLIAAILLGARSLSPSVDHAFGCVVAALGGGNTGCSGGTTAGDTGTPTGSDSPTNTQNTNECGALCQIGGVFKGFGEGIVDTAKGLWTLGSDAVKYALGDQETRDKYAQLVQAFKDDPLGTGKAMLEAMVEPMVTDWREGRYGEAVGRGIFEVISTVGGPKGVDKLGKLGKVDDIARAAGKVDNIRNVARALGKGEDGLSDAAKAAEHLPCVGALPNRKGA